MKFKQYLTEMLQPSQLIEMNQLIHKNCKPYLKLIKGKMPLYRGMNDKNVIWGDIWTGEKKVRTNRRSRGGTKPQNFKIINDWLQKHNHNRRDNSIMCISDITRLAMFGMSYTIFPVGKMSYTWIESHDFNYSNDTSGWQGGMNHYIEHIKAGESTEEMYNREGVFKMKKSVIQYFHTDERFNEGYAKKYEFWIKCKSYYYVNAQTDELEWDKNKQIFL